MPVSKLSWVNWTEINSGTGCACLCRRSRERPSIDEVIRLSHFYRRQPGALPPVLVVYITAVRRPASAATAAVVTGSASQRQVASLTVAWPEIRTFSRTFPLGHCPWLPQLKREEVANAFNVGMGLIKVWIMVTNGVSRFILCLRSGSQRGNVRGKTYRGGVLYTRCAQHKRQRQRDELAAVSGNIRALLRSSSASSSCSTIKLIDISSVE